MHDWVNETDRTPRKVECKCKYKDLEKELIKLTGYDLETLRDKFKAGYILQGPEEPLPIKYTEDDEQYAKLCKAAHKLEPWFDIDKVKSYTVYVWTKGEDDEHPYGENVFDIHKGHLQFYQCTKPWQIPNEVWPIIQEIQELLI